MKLTQKPQALLFDLDGTLADTIGQLSVAARRTAQSLGLTVPDVETTKSYVGNGINMLLSRIIAGKREFEAGEVDPLLLKKARRAFNGFYFEGLERDFRVYDGVKEGLKFFRENGIKTAAVTNKPQVFARPLLGFMGLSPLFDFILGGEILQERKPDPRPLLYTAAHLYVDPALCVMVGDSDNDILGGINAKMPTAFIKGGYYHGDITKVGPDYICESFSDFNHVIEGLV